MKTLKIFLSITTLSTLLLACNGNDKKKGISSISDTILNISKTNIDTTFALSGKKITIEYPEMKAEVEYLSDSTLHWKTTSLENIVEDGFEKISIQQISNNLFFINWIEKDGITVSQVLDITNKRVYAYMSFSDKGSPRGQRSAILTEGKITFKK